MKQLARDIAPKVLDALGKFPIIGIMGPRQSGKTTLCQMLKPAFTYVNLEDISFKEFC